MLSEEERKERRRAMDRSSARRRRDLLLPEESPVQQSAPRLTLDPGRASIVRDPDTGQTYPANSERGLAWLNRMKA